MGKEKKEETFFFIFLFFKQLTPGGKTNFVYFKIGLENFKKKILAFFFLFPIFTSAVPFKVIGNGRPQTQQKSKLESLNTDLCWEDLTVVPSLCRVK